MKALLKTALVAVVLLVICAGLFFYESPLQVADEMIRYHLWREHVRGRYVQAGPYRLHYFEALPPAGSPDRPLVLIHGLGSRGEDWSPLIPRLAAQGFHVYAPDLLGYGRSARPDVDYSIALEEKTMVDFLNAIHLQKADVAGWSMGGWVAMKLAADQSDRVTRLLLYDSAGTYFAATFQPDLFVPTDVAGLKRLMAAISPHPRSMAPFIQRDALRKLDRNGWIVSRSVSSMISGRDLMDFRLHEIQQPTLIVWGSHDDLIPLATGEAIHRAIPQSTLAIIQGCGHLAPAECTDAVLQATIPFLKADPPERGGEHIYKSAG